MENKNQSVDENMMKDEKENKKKFSPGTIIVPVIIIVILVAFAGVIYYGKAIKPNKDFDKKLGYHVEDYITVNNYTGFDYEITQKMFDDCVYEETDSYEIVKKRAVQDTDQVEFDYVGYVDGKKDENISQEEVEVTLNGDITGIFKTFADAMIGHKAKETVTVEVDGTEVQEISSDGSDYSGKTVTFEIKITSVSKLVREEIDDKWVKENYLDDYGLETTADFYEWCKSYLEQQATSEIWQKVLDNTTMSSYPQEVYDDVVTEFTEDANYNADMFGMTTEEYLKDFCGYTDETLEEEYLNEVKSELVMWYIVKIKGLEATTDEIEDKYDELYADVGYDSIDEMKQEYSKNEIEEAVLLEKAQKYVYDHSNVKETFTIPE